MRTSALFRSVSISLIVACLPLSAAAQTQQSFSDVPPTHPVYQAAEYLKARGIISGYADGTFKPDAKVNRAEAMKILVSPLVPAAQLAQFTTSVYTDAPVGAWFIPYVEAGRQLLGVIDGPPKTTVFNGQNPVKKVEFFKMLLLSNKIDPAASYSEITLPLATDVTSAAEWYYPYMRYALASSIAIVDENGNLNPAGELTRGDVALFMHRFFMYQEGRRTQALLTEAEDEIVNVLKLLDSQSIDQADYASARALIATRGALTSFPDEAVVKGAVKTAEGFRILLQAYRAGMQGQLEQVLELCSNAWHIAEKAREFSPGLDAVATQMQNISKSMADEARKLIAERDAAQ